MTNVIFLGTEFNKGKGGVASVLREYSKIFPNATFISTTASNGKLLNFLTLLIAVIKLPCILIVNRKAIVHIHGASYNSFKRKKLLYQIIRLFGNKVVYHIHGAEFHDFFFKSTKKRQRKISNLINNVDCVICLSLQWKQFFLTNFEPIKIEILPNIVEEPTHLGLPISKTTFDFLFLGHISERKGIWLLLSVVEQLKFELKGKFVFYIGGNGEVEKLKMKIKEKKLEGIIEFIGWVSDEKKIQYLNKADAFILPSYNEGLPISILEAMTYGLPIVSTKVGGIPEVLKDGINGFLIEPGNECQLSLIIKKVINDPVSFVSLGQNNSTLIQPYLPHNVKNSLIKIYSEI